MDELNVITWIWGDKYGVADIKRLSNAVGRNLLIPHQFILFSDRPYDIPGVFNYGIDNPELIGRGCFCRLRMFDPDWQKRCAMDNAPILGLDLDAVITGPIDDIVKTESSFKILQDVNAANPCKFNASVMLLKPGHHGDVWSDFSIEKASTAPFYEFPDDQGWIWHKLPNADGWKAGPGSGIYGFCKPGWPSKTLALPDDARIVSFIGWRKPEKFKNLPWMQKHWR